MNLKRLGVLCLLLASVLATAQSPATGTQVSVPRFIRVSGQFENVSGTVGITFSLHKSQRDDVALWIETQSVSLDATGKYSVLLGATKPDGIPLDLFASSDAQWLSIQVEGKPEQPRVLLVSVPYALKAAEADTLAGHAASEFVTSDKLSTAVQQELQHSQAVEGTKQTPATGLKSNAITSGATNFTATTSNQVVAVTQTGTGAGLVASAAGTAIRGTSSAAGSLGVQGLSTATTGAGAGVRGSVASPAGNGIYGSNSSTTGAAIGVLATSQSTAGVALRGSANATTGATQGLQAQVASPAGIAGVFRNTSTGKLLSGQAGSAHNEVFFVDNAGVVTGAAFNLGVYQFVSGSPSTGDSFFGFAGNGSFLGSNTGVGFYALSGATSGFNTAVGAYSLYAGSSGTAVGYDALHENTGDSNTAVGLQAMAFNTTGGFNTATGVDALFYNTTGSYNTAFGALALYQNGDAINNTAVGYNALAGNQSGGNNTATGSFALKNNVSGSENTAVGYGALNSNMVSGNTAVGFFALVGNNDGNSNTALGSGTLQSNVSGSENVAVGYQALNLNTSDFNAALGHQALAKNTTGASNTAVGTTSLYTNTTGGQNAAFGNLALYGNTTGINNTAVGNWALKFNTTGGSNTAVGNDSLPNDAGSYNTSIGAYAHMSLTSGSYNIALGYNAGSTLTQGTNNIYIGNAGVSGESNTIRIGTGSAPGGGHSAFFAGGVVGSILASGAAVYISPAGQLGTVSSSRRYKDDIEDIGDDSRALLQLRPVKFRYKVPAADGSKPLQFGLIAEEVAQVLPDAVLYNEGGEPDAVQYNKINAMLLNEVQRQQHQIDAQGSEIETQNAKIQALQSVIEELKALVSNHAH